MQVILVVLAVVVEILPALVEQVHQDKEIMVVQVTGWGLVVVVPAEVFATGRHGADGVRISIGAATDRAALAEALTRLAALA